jgi:hypothetical protein
MSGREKKIHHQDRRIEDIIDDTNNHQTIQGLYDFSPSPKA